MLVVMAQAVEMRRENKNKPANWCEWFFLARERKVCKAHRVAKNNNRDLAELDLQ
jgi:hypothetical protein